MTQPFAGARIEPSAVTRALAEAAPRCYWTDRPRQSPGPVRGASEGGPTNDPELPATADLVVVGAGLTGLWAALEAAERHPDRSIVVLEQQDPAFGASGRNGGFVSASLTHGLAHGFAHWPQELPELLRLGRQNLDDIVRVAQAEGIDADLRLTGKTVVALTPSQVETLGESHALHRAWGEEVELLDAEQARADVASPTYAGALRVRSGCGVLDPVRLVDGLWSAVVRRGVVVHTRCRVTGLERDGSGVRVAVSRAGTAASHGLRTGRVIVATSAYPPPLRRLRHWVIPVYDHVLVSEPLDAGQRASLGWVEEQGVTDCGNRFHYYRLTADGRILWGGYDAVYYFGNRTDASLEQREASHRRLAAHFLVTFPQLRGIRFTHRWAGLIDSTSRFTAMFGTALGGRLAYSLGYTGLGVAASRFGARVALDLLDGRDTERTRLTAVRTRPVPFPPEPLRYPVIQATRAALAAQDDTGRRGAWLSLLDRFGVGFTS